MYLLSLFSIGWLKNNHFEIQCKMHMNDLCRIYNISVSTTKLTLLNQNTGLQFLNGILLNCTPWSTNRKKRKQLPKVWPLLYTQQRKKRVQNVYLFAVQSLSSHQLDSKRFLTFFNCYCANRMLKAITIQHTATYGLFRSPILAHFQNMPNNPVLFLSSKLGAKDRI